MMKHTINFEKGKKYLVDEKYGGKEHQVTLVHFWPETMVFGKVRNDAGYEWETMLCRLTEIKK